MTIDRIPLWLNNLEQRITKAGQGNNNGKKSNQSQDWLFDLLSIIKGFRNGLVYGVKIRLPHALVMTFLFRSEPFWDKIQTIWRLTKNHCWNLARFVAIYKTLMILLRRLSRRGEQTWHSLIAGAIGGYCIFSSDTPVNTQIVLYLVSRVLTALAKLLVGEIMTKVQNNQKQALPSDTLQQKAFTIEATLVWGLVMWLFRHHGFVLHSSLYSSMEYLYNNSDRWNSLWTLLIHNQ